MNKHEKEDHYRHYVRLISQAESALKGGSIVEAISHAVSSFEHLRGMLRYCRPKQDSPAIVIEAIAIVLEWAPLIFDVDSLDKIATLLKDQRTIQKASAVDVLEELSSARRRVSHARVVWTEMERFSRALPTPANPTIDWHAADTLQLVEAWHFLGIVNKAPSEDGRATLWTTADAKVRAKCFACGKVAMAKKGTFFQEVLCPHCKTSGFFILLRDGAIGVTED